jgi:hypothetical protein
MKTKTYRSAICLLVSLVTLIHFIQGVALAEIVSTPAELQSSKRVSEYISSQTMAKYMFTIGAAMDVKLGIQAGCKSNYQVKPINVVIYSPIELQEGKSNPVKGVWQVRYKLERCGEAKVYNAIFFANANGEIPKMNPFYPGTTMASARLVKDALPSAFITARSSKWTDTKDCQETLVFDMKPVDSGNPGPKPGQPGSVWNEIWTLQLCGERIDVQMTFTTDADGKGTSFLAHPIAK